MRLGEEHRLARGQRARQPTAIRRAVIAPLERGVEGRARLGQRETLVERGNDVTPGVVARREQRGPDAEPAPPEAILRGGAGKPGGER